MKRLLTIGLMSLALASVYSNVYAHDHSADASKSTRVTRSSHDVVTTTGKTIRTVVVCATSGCPAVEPVVALDIDVPGRTTPRYIHIEAIPAEDQSSASVIRTAMTLGRAFLTTVGAVMGELIDAATEKTARLV